MCDCGSCVCTCVLAVFRYWLWCWPLPLQTVCIDIRPTPGRVLRSGGLQTLETHSTAEKDTPWHTPPHKHTLKVYTHRCPWKPTTSTNTLHSSSSIITRSILHPQPFIDSPLGESTHLYVLPPIYLLTVMNWPLWPQEMPNDSPAPC